MARNRMIKLDFWADEKIGKLSLLARLLFVGSWNFADDGGDCRANEIYLRNNIFPYDDITITQISDAINELVNIGLIKLVEQSGERYLRINNFLKHQTINKPSNFRYISSSSVVVVEEQSLPKEKEKEKEKSKYLHQKLLDFEQYYNSLNDKKIRMTAQIQKKVKDALIDESLELWKEVIEKSANKGHFINNVFVPLSAEKMLENYSKILEETYSLVTREESKKIDNKGDNYYVGYDRI